MKFEAFRERSLIMGILLSSQSLTKWLKSELNAKSELSVLGSLILASLHFEGVRHPTGPSRLAKTLGASRIRVSQELLQLGDQGFLRRSLDTESARAISVTLTAAGERRAVEIVKTYTKLQRIIDSTIGEAAGESTNESLLKLALAFK